jgi:hypothetical protein
MRIITLHPGFVLLLALTLVPVTELTAGDRHAGTVLSVGLDSLVVDELGRAGTAHMLYVTVTPRTSIIVSQRNPQAPEFTDTPISLAEVKKGDFVGIDTSREGSKLVAVSITVTLRQETQVVRPDPKDSAPPLTTGAAPFVPRVERREQPPAPPAPATAPAQPLAPYDAEDPRAVIEWLLYPASVRTR